MITLPEALLPRGVGYGWVDRRFPLDGTVRAHLDDGRCVQCVARGPAPLAVDAESVECPSGRELAIRHGIGVEHFLALWTRAEVAAKLLGHPSLLAFRECVAHDPALTIRTIALGDLIVSVGWHTR